MTLKTIRTQTDYAGYAAAYLLLGCLTSERGSGEYKNYLIAAAMKYEKIGCLIYKNAEGDYVKPPAKMYDKYFFDAWLETAGEIRDRVMPRREVTLQEAEYMLKLVRKISGIVCPMMATYGEHLTVIEYAYSIDYVISHGGDIPDPVFDYSLFPENYPDFNPFEPFGFMKEEEDKYQLYW
ncbi:MAG: hypothetical protein IKX86_01115 [Clostridia bacterium]|nr:hypothetical protein [Clostridia bacterium]MBR5767262.1 hypothetical protein [Clostridia bacterium]